MRLLLMIQLSLLATILTPITEVVARKKSKILLLLRIFPVFDFAEVPRLITHLVGRLAPAGPMLFPITMLLLLPAAAVVVLKRTFPVAAAAVPVEEPRMLQLARILFDAPLMNRPVLVPAVVATVVFESVSWPYPSMRTLFAPFRSISGVPAVIAPETVRVPLGNIRMEV